MKVDNKPLEHHINGWDIDTSCITTNLLSYQVKNLVSLKRS